MPISVFQGSVFSSFPYGGSNSTTVKSVSNNNILSASFPEPIGKGRTGSLSDAFGAFGPIAKAPGSEREDINVSYWDFLFIFIFCPLSYVILDIMCDKSRS